MSVAGLRYQPKAWGHSSAPAETKSGSEKVRRLGLWFPRLVRTKVRVLQHRERQRREVLKDLRAAASAKSHSTSPRKWKGRSSKASSMQSVHPTEGESSSGIPASPSSARRGRPTSFMPRGEGFTTFRPPRLLQTKTQSITTCT